MATAFTWGHKMVFNHYIYSWVYADDGSPVDEAYPRQCIRCGKFPNPDGSDACLGHIGGVVSACCGHGVEKPICMSSHELMGELERED